MIEGFAAREIESAAGVKIYCAVGGGGPAVLLLHGWPETHLCWRKVAFGLARAGFSVVVPDLRGYGDSGKPATTPDHAPYSKRTTAQDMVDVMRTLGHEKFAVFGHDRGARVAHRMALDHPGAVEKVAVLDIAPTATMYAQVDRTFAQIYYHWFFLIQPFDMPERMIGADPEWFLKRTLGVLNGPTDAFDAVTIAEYVRAMKLPGAIHAMCEDYRAAASIDLKHDAEDEAAGRKVEAPLLALWGANGLIARRYDALATWREKAKIVSGRALPCGHFLPEEAPAETLEALLEFLRGPALALLTHKSGMREARFTRTLAHPQSAVWASLTETARLPAWLAPGEIAQRVKLKFADSGTVIDSAVTAFEPGRVVEYSWSAPGEPARPLRWEIAPHGEGCALTLTAAIPESEDIAKTAAGWEAHLAMLAAALDGAPIPFPFEVFKTMRERYKQA